MSEINRKAGALWTGDAKSGVGMISTESRALYALPYSYRTRYGEQTGTNPEELLASAHATCFSMALADTLKKNGFEPKKADTVAICTIASNNGSHQITGMKLHVRAEVPGIREAVFQEMVHEADQSCPVSNLLRNVLEIEIAATLI